MARVLSAAEAVYANNEGIGQYTGALAPMTRLDIDGQNGITTDFRTLNANTPYVKQDLICFLLEVPRVFSYLPGGREMAIALKTILETRSTKISGLDATIKAEYAEVAAGRTESMSVHVKTTRERSQPSHTLDEVSGMAIYHLIETWIVMGMADPVTGVPGVVTLEGAKERFSALGNGAGAYTLMPENTSATCLYVEPDITRSYPVKAFLCTGLQPDQGGSYTGDMDIQGTPSTEEVTITFTCMQEVSNGVLNLAAQALASINKVGLSSNNRRAYIGDKYETIAAKLLSERGLSGRPVGYQAQANEIASTESINNMEGNVLSKAQFNVQEASKGTAYRSDT